MHRPSPSPWRCRAYGSSHTRLPCRRGKACGQSHSGPILCRPAHHDRDPDPPKSWPSIRLAFEGEEARCRWDSTGAGAPMLWRRGERRRCSSSSSSSSYAAAAAAAAQRERVRAAARAGQGPVDELVQETAPAPLHAAAGVTPAALSGGASAAASREAEAERLALRERAAGPDGAQPRAPAPAPCPSKRARAARVRLACACLHPLQPPLTSGAGVGVAQPHEDVSG